jgi:hypothetical protein
MGFITARAEVEKAKAAGDMTAADGAGAERARLDRHAAAFAWLQQSRRACELALA